MQLELSPTDNNLAIDQVSLTSIAETFGTPCYVYSASSLVNVVKDYQSAFAGKNVLLCYAVKANSNLSILRQLSQLGVGCDIVSGGELARALAAGISANRIVFSGVGKTSLEITAALHAGIHCFNVESEAELHRINHIAEQLNIKAPISLRINPDVDAKTHPYISTGLKNNKFGINYQDARTLYINAASLANLNVIGIDCHIGSQLTEIAPFIDALDRLLLLVDQLDADGVYLQHIDLGGGLGICYNDEIPPSIYDYAKAIYKRLEHRKLKLILEPGRSLIGNAGLLLTRIEYLKLGAEKNFAIVDAAMNDLLRPSLYDAFHQIVAIKQSKPNSSMSRIYDVVGPICESSDVLGKDRQLAIEEGDLLAILSAGAYGMSMSSNYNSRPRIAEVLVENNISRLISHRETIDDMLKNELSLLI